MIGMRIVRVLAVSLGFTIILEEALAWTAGIRNRWDMILIGLVNVLTNPAVVFIHYMYRAHGGRGRGLVFVTAAAELSAVIAEAFCYKAAARNIRHPWMFSIGANLFSFIAGLAVNKLL
jgi:hypothetical protein